jgi:hypothetical protein
MSQVDAAAEQRIMADHERMFNLGYHANIVQLYGVCPATPQNPVMLCMEFMEVTPRLATSPPYSCAPTDADAYLQQ